jgi:hypothetical protein
MLAYYVEWHMRRKLAPMLFDDEDKEGALASRPIETNPHPGSKPTAQSLTFCLPTHLKLVTSSPSKIRRLSFQNS